MTFQVDLKEYDPFSQIPQRFPPTAFMTKQAYTRIDFALKAVQPDRFPAET